MQKPSPLWLILPSLLVLLKDAIATLGLFATEPGITAKAHYYYAVALVPGSWLVSDALPAIIVNFLLGVLAGLALFLGLRFMRRGSSPS